MEKEKTGKIGRKCGREERRVIKEGAAVFRGKEVEEAEEKERWRGRIDKREERR